MHSTVLKKQKLNIGVLGCGFMGDMHSHAYQTISHMFPDLNVAPHLYVIADGIEKKVESAAGRYGYEKWSTSLNEVLNDPLVDVIDICLPEYLHKDICIAAIESGKHIFCEKPLALNSEDCMSIINKTQRNSPKKAMCGFNHRFLPAIRFAKEMISQKLLGDIYFIRANYFQESGHNPKRAADEIGYLKGKEQLGNLRGIGSHLIDTVRFLVGDIRTVFCNLKTFIPERQTTSGNTIKINVEDIAVMDVEIESGALGSMTASALATGRKNQLAFEINGSLGSLQFDLEDLNILKVYLEDGVSPQYRGFSRINVTDRTHPFMKYWWPPAHILGWEHGHIHELHHFIKSIAEGETISPWGASFIDGYKAAQVADCAVKAFREGKRYTIPVLGT